VSADEVLKQQYASAGQDSQRTHESDIVEEFHHHHFCRSV